MPPSPPDEAADTSEDNPFHQKTESLIFQVLNALKSPITRPNVEAFGVLCKHLNPLARLPDFEAIQNQEEHRATPPKQLQCIVCQKSLSRSHHSSILIENKHIYRLLTPLVHYQVMDLDTAKEAVKWAKYKMCIEHCEEVNELSIELKDEIEKFNDEIDDSDEWPRGFPIMKALVEANKGKFLRNNVNNCTESYYTQQMCRADFLQVVLKRNDEDIAANAYTSTASVQKFGRCAVCLKPATDDENLHISIGNREIYKMLTAMVHHGDISLETAMRRVKAEMYKICVEHWEKMQSLINILIDDAKLAHSSNESTLPGLQVMKILANSNDSRGLESLGELTNDRYCEYLGFEFFDLCPPEATGSEDQKPSASASTSMALVEGEEEEEVSYSDLERADGDDEGFGRRTRSSSKRQKERAPRRLLFRQQGPLLEFDSQLGNVKVEEVEVKVEKPQRPQRKTRQKRKIVEESEDTLRSISHSPSPPVSVPKSEVPYTQTLSYQCVVCQRQGSRSVKTACIETGNIYRVLTPLVHFGRIDLRTAKMMLIQPRYRTCMEHCDEIFALINKLKLEIEAAGASDPQDSPPGFDTMRELVEYNGAKGLQNDMFKCGIETFKDKICSEFFEQYLPQSDGTCPPPPPVSSYFNIPCVVCQKSTTRNIRSMKIEVERIYQVLTTLVYYREMDMETAKRMIVMSTYNMCTEHIESVHKLIHKLKLEVYAAEKRQRVMVPPGYRVLEVLVETNNGRGMSGDAMKRAYIQQMCAENSMKCHDGTVKLEVEDEGELESKPELKIPFPTSRPPRNTPQAVRNPTTIRFPVKIIQRPGNGQGFGMQKPMRTLADALEAAGEPELKIPKIEEPDERE